VDEPTHAGEVPYGWRSCRSGRRSPRGGSSAPPQRVQQVPAWRSRCCSARSRLGAAFASPLKGDRKKASGCLSALLAANETANAVYCPESSRFHPRRFQGTPACVFKRRHGKQEEGEEQRRDGRLLYGEREKSSSARGAYATAAEERGAADRACA